MTSSSRSTSITERPTDTPDGSHPALDELAVRTARWIGALFLLEVLLQRFQIPGRPVAILLPVIFVWVVLALRARLVQFDARRGLAWVALASASGAALVLQTALLSAPLISVDSWMLFIVVWLPAVIRLVDRRLSTYVLALRKVVSICTALAAVCIVMMTSQLVGIGYQDYLAQFVPANLLLDGFVITYPIEFGSSIFRSNAWIGLEPSIISFLIGTGLLAGILVRAYWWQTLIMAIGLFTAYSGSGFFVVIVGIAVMAFFSARRLLLPYALPAGALGTVAIFTPLVQPLIERSSGELTDDSSSASLRAVQPYLELWPRWSNDSLGAMIGRGAGSAQRYVNDLSIDDLLVPTFGRILFDYGLLPGAVIIAALLFYYFDGPSSAIACTMFVSLWALQPGGSQIVFALPVMALVTFFAPRPGRRLEQEPDLSAQLGRPPRRRMTFLVRPPAHLARRIPVRADHREPSPPD